jgi:hypothetical protein
MQLKLPMHLSPRCGALPDDRAAVPERSNGEWPLPDARRTSGCSEGNRNAFKHGRYTAEAIADRREVAALIRAMRAVACSATEEERCSNARPISANPRD